MFKKFSPFELKMTVVISDCDGNVTSELCSSSSAQLTFQKFVLDCVGRHSYIREISLYDSANRLYKTYKQLF